MVRSGRYSHFISRLAPGTGRGLRLVLLLLVLPLLGLAHCAEENPFLPKISHRGLPSRTSGSFELKILQVGVDIIATLSKSDNQDLIPDTYGGSLQGTWGSPSTVDDAGVAGTGTYLNSEFKIVPFNAGKTDPEPSESSTACNNELSCGFSPRDDSVFLMHFELTKDGGLVQNSLEYIKANYGSGTTPQDQLANLMKMTPGNIPIQNIPYLGTAYTVLISIFDFFGLGDTLDGAIRSGVASTYGIGVNDFIVSPKILQEAVVRILMYPVADGEIIKAGDIKNRDRANKSHLVVLCEENSSPKVADHGANRVKPCSTPGALRPGPRGNQFLPVPPHEALDNGPDVFRDPANYSTTRLALPVFLGDALADFKTLAVKDYKTLLDLESGLINRGQAGSGRLSFIDPVFEEAGQGITVASPKTELMFGESSENPDPDPGEFWMRLPVKVPGLARDGFDFSRGDYAGEDSVTADGILIYIGDRGAFNKCFPNGAGQKMALIGTPSAEGIQAGCVDVGGGSDPTGAGMTMGNMESEPKMSMKMKMEKDQVLNTVFASIHYQYADKAFCIGFTIYNFCDFGFELELEPMTQDLVPYFYTATDMTFDIENIDVGLTREQMSAAVKSTFNGTKNNGRPVVDLGEFQSVLPCNNSTGTDCYYCDPLEAGYPQTCYARCNSENPNWLNSNTAFCRPVVDAGGKPVELTEAEKLAKADAQRPLRRISDVLFDNSVGSPNIYADLLYLNTNESGHSGPGDELDGAEGNGTPILFWKDQGGSNTAVGFYVDETLSRPICAEEFAYEHCVTSKKIFTNSGNGAAFSRGNKEGDKAALYISDSAALIVNNVTKTVYTQDETGSIYRLTVYKSPNPRKINVDWERL